MFQLAGIPAIGEGFISDKYTKMMQVQEEEEEEVEMDAEESAEEAPADLGGEEEMELGAEEAPAADGGEISQDKIEAIVDAVLAGIEQETGVPLERVGSSEAPAEEEPEAEAVPTEEPADMGGESEEEEEEMVGLDERLVKEVSRRVARRLIQMTKKNK